MAKDRKDGISKEVENLDPRMASVISRRHVVLFMSWQISPSVPCIVTILK